MSVHGTSMIAAARERAIPGSWLGAMESLELRWLAAEDVTVQGLWQSALSRPAREIQVPRSGLSGNKTPHRVVRRLGISGGLFWERVAASAARPNTFFGGPE
jgi:hypothetical protein